LNVRHAEIADGESIRLLARDLGYPAEPDEMAARLARVLADPNQAVFVAEEPDGIVGFAYVYETATLLDQPRAEIGGLFVNPAFRRKGIGRLLMDTLEAWAREHGFHLVRVRSSLLRTEAHALYRSLGYECMKTAHVFTKTI
jgi:GNAT superfamily N-acetyltransferase